MVMEDVSTVKNGPVLLEPGRREKGYLVVGAVGGTSIFSFFFFLSTSFLFADDMVFRSRFYNLLLFEGATGTH
jgi:hypothetical protein